MRNLFQPGGIRFDSLFSWICFLLLSGVVWGQQAEAEPKPKAEENASEDDEKKLPVLQPGALLGKDLSGWKVLKQHDFDKHGKVTLEKGVLSLPEGSPATGVAIEGKQPPQSNYELTLEARRTKGSDFFCGLTFPVGDNFCTLIIGGWGGGVTGLSNIDGMSAVDNETTGFIEVKDNQWYKIKLQVTDEKIQAWLGDDSITEVARKNRKFSIWWEQEPARPLGIVTWNTSAEIRNLQLKLLKPEPEEKPEKKPEKKPEEKPESEAKSESQE